ncbi:MAG: ABC transporter ATP-binding protein [Anaerolineae bacterium]|nr:ABC transporter ATP-binding protein [Anaerolineae bacterium]
MENPNDLLVEVKDLKTHFFMNQGVVKAVDGVNLKIKRGNTIGIVGESGCGKSVTARAILRIVEHPGRIVEGEINFWRPIAEGHTKGSNNYEVINLAKLDERGQEMRNIRGREISMIFQEPMSSLSPFYTIGNQIAENLLLHQESLTKERALERTIELLRLVGIPRPELRINDYPFQLSGGMCQRSIIAMAIACNPSMLIADEPTTALDVTTQAQILALMQDMQEKLGMAIMLITHDLGVVAEMADDVSVMYLGRVAETANVDAIFHDARHPYTKALLRSIPKVSGGVRERLNSIRGMVPDPFNRPEGCVFHPRCDEFIPGICDKQAPTLVEIAPGHHVSCWAATGN